MLTACGATHQGKVRKVNEDSWVCDVDVGLFIVADGMGGHNAGEVASKLTVEVIREFVEHTRDVREATWPYGFDPSLSRDANRLSTAIKLANRKVFAAGESQADYSGMGTTVVAALIEEDRLTFSGVGDSRIYVFANGVLSQLTRDDSWVATVLAGESGLGEVSLARHPLRHLLTKVVGAHPDTEVDIGERTLGAGELALLCSDGLHGALDESTIRGILGSQEETEAAARTLIETALDHAGSDNITAVLVRYDR